MTWLFMRSRKCGKRIMLEEIAKIYGVPLSKLRNHKKSTWSSFIDYESYHNINDWVKQRFFNNAKKD